MHWPIDARLPDLVGPGPLDVFGSCTTSLTCDAVPTAECAFCGGNAVQVMTSRRFRRGLAACIAALATALTPGCSTNFDAQTNQIYQPGVGSNSRDGDVYVLDALVVTDGSGLGTISAGLVDEVTGPDALIGVSARSPAGNRVRGMILTHRVRLPSLRLVQLSDAGDVILSAAKPLNVGGTINVTFTFQNAGPVTLDLPIVMNTGDFAPVPVPTPSATPLQTPTTTPTPRDTPTDSPTP
jgi:copper(I)-binding protein